eukprot:s919_g2.t4
MTFHCWPPRTLADNGTAHRRLRRLDCSEGRSRRKTNARRLQSQIKLGSFLSPAGQAIRKLNKSLMCPAPFCRLRALTP